LHIPIQSGDDHILKLMNHKYSRKDYENLIIRLKTQIPGISITTDCLIGFPGETEADFEATVDLAKKVGWKVAFVARYSPRPGTAAWRIYADDVAAAEKKRRWEILDELINKSQLADRPIIV